MSHTARLKRPPAAFRQLTGITRAAFDRLRADLEPRYAAADPASDPGAEAVLRREKKRHAVERHVAVTRRRKKPGPGAKPRRVRIAAVSGAFPGKTHDEKVYDQARVVAPPGVKRTGDAGYVGTALGGPDEASPEGDVDGPSEGGEPACVEAADRGRTRDREDEGVADPGRRRGHPRSGRAEHAHRPEHPDRRAGGRVHLGRPARGDRRVTGSTSGPVPGAGPPTSR